MNKKKLPMIVGMAALRELLGLMRDVIEPGVSIFGDIIKSRLIYEVDCSKYILYKHRGSAIAELFPNITRIIKMEHFNDKHHKMCEFSDSESCDYRIFNGTPIVLMIRRCDDDRGGSYTKASLYTLNTKNHVRNLHKFLNMVRDRSVQLMKKEWDKYWWQVVNEHGQMRRYEVIHPRTFDDVFIPDKQLKELLNAIDNYRSKGKWYEEKHIPNHFGIMLYGVPSSGKTSIVQALASYMKVPVVFMNGDLLHTLPEIINDNFFGMSDCWYDRDLCQILLIEDIDCGMVSHSRSLMNCNNNTNDDKNAVGLGSILNALDGINAPSNVIYVFTTNHVEKLDPALIRPGRIDLQLEIGYVCRETFQKFCKFHYGEIDTSDFDIKDGLTFAQLQVMVMKGMTLQELVKEVSVVKTNNNQTSMVGPSILW